MISQPKLLKFVYLVLILIFASLACRAFTPQETQSEPEQTQVVHQAQVQNNSLERIQDIGVPMPDGVRLATTLYFPEGEGPWPALMMRTPYGRQELSDMGRWMAEVGVVGVMQDVRGRFDSEGQDLSFFADHDDGQATLNWLNQQDWFNGRAMTFGGSALGITQYLLAPGAPETLHCQWIEVASPDLYANAIYQGGVYRESLTTGWLEGNNSSHRIEPIKSNYLNSDYWDPVRITDKFSAVHVAAVHVAGWYDIFARGTIEGFLGYQNQGGQGAAGQQHLIMGPWTHAINDPQVGELRIPNADLGTYDALQELMLRACLFDEAEAWSALDAWPAVQYFTMGAVGEAEAPGNEWRTAEGWPPLGSTETAFYLHDDNKLSLDMPGTNVGSDSFSYDPNNPTPTIGGANLNIPAGSFDQSVIETRSDVVVYSTEPLEQAVEVTGDLRFQVWISSDVPDTDIIVRLTDVYPDGRSMLIADGAFRARYHASPDFSNETWLETDKPVLLTIDLGPTSIIFNRGHRIRVSVTSANAPRFAINPNTGAMYLGDGEQGQIAHTDILHDAEYPSALILPVVSGLPQK